MTPTIQETNYHGWKALRLDTGESHIVVPLDIGPRIIACHLGDGDNLFKNVRDDLGGSSEEAWRIRGGHRLWHAPEQQPRTYLPDNDPIAVKILGDSAIRLDQPTEVKTGMRKSMLVEAVAPTTFKVTHTIANQGVWPIQCSAWALTVLEHGGYATIPLLPKGRHPQDLLPAYHLVPWPYTDLSRPSWQIRSDCIGIDVARADRSQKLGISNYPGWAAYWQKSGTFVKYSPVRASADYPDSGSAFEVYTCDWMIELETLSPLVTVPPGGAIVHVEHWGLLGDLPKPDKADALAGTFGSAVRDWIDTIS